MEPDAAYIGRMYGLYAVPSIRVTFGAQTCVLTISTGHYRAHFYELFLHWTPPLQHSY